MILLEILGAEGQNRTADTGIFSLLSNSLSHKDATFRFSKIEIYFIVFLIFFYVISDSKR